MKETINDDLTDFFPQKPEGEMVPITDTMTPEQLERWKARIKEFNERENET
jgi:hypothetical protein